MSYKNSSMITRQLSAQNSGLNPAISVSTAPAVLTPAQAAESSPSLDESQESVTSVDDGIGGEAVLVPIKAKVMKVRKKAAPQVTMVDPASISNKLPTKTSGDEINAHVVSQPDPGIPARSSVVESPEPTIFLQSPTAIADFNPYGSTPRNQVLYPLGRILVNLIDKAITECPENLSLVIRSYGCDPLSQDGKSEISGPLARSLAETLISLRKDPSKLPSIRPEVIPHLLRFCHIDGKDSSAEGVRKSLAKLADHFLLPVLRVATFDEAFLRSTPVFGLWAFMATLGGKIVANVKKDVLINSVKLAQQQAVLQGFAVPKVVQPMTSWTFPDIPILRAMSLTVLNLMLGMTESTADDEDSKEEIIRQIISFQGPFVDNTAISRDVTRALLTRGPLLRGFLDGFGIPFASTVNLSVPQLESMIPTTLSNQIPHVFAERVYCDPRQDLFATPATQAVTAAVADGTPEDGDAPSGSFDAFGNPVYDSDFQTPSVEGATYRPRQSEPVYPTNQGTPAYGCPTVYQSASMSASVRLPLPFGHPSGTFIGGDPRVYPLAPVSGYGQGMLSSFPLTPSLSYNPFFPPVAPPFAQGGPYAGSQSAWGTQPSPVIPQPQGMFGSTPDTHNPVPGGVPEARVVSMAGQRQEFTLQQLQRKDVDFLVQLNSTLYRAPPAQILPKEVAFLADTAFRGLPMRGFLFLLDSTAKIVATERLQDLRTEWWPLVGRHNPVDIVVLCDVSGQRHQATYRIFPSTNTATFLITGNPDLFPGNGELRVGTPVTMVSPQMRQPPANGSPPVPAGYPPNPYNYATPPYNGGNDAAISNMLETQASLKRSSAKGTSIVSDETRTSKIPGVLSRDPIAAGKQSFRDIQVAHNLQSQSSPKQGTTATQMSYEDVILVAKSIHAVAKNLSHFTPLTVTKSEECARLRVREILGHRSDAPYPHTREYLLNEDPDRWQASMEQVFLVFSAIFLVYPEVTAGLFGVAARSAAMIRGLADWRHEDLEVIFRNAFDQIDDLLLRVGHDIVSAYEFVNCLQSLPALPPGSTLYNIYSAMQVVNHKAWVAGTASHDKRYVPAQQGRTNLAPKSPLVGTGKPDRSPKQAPRKKSQFCAGFNAVEQCVSTECGYSHKRPLTAADALKLIKICEALGLTPTKNLKALGASTPVPHVTPKAVNTIAPGAVTEKPAKAPERGILKRVKINTGGGTGSSRQVNVATRSAPFSENTNRVFEHAIDQWRLYTDFLHRYVDLSFRNSGGNVVLPTHSEWIDGIIGFITFIRLTGYYSASTVRFLYVRGIARFLSSWNCAGQFIEAAFSEPVQAVWALTNTDGPSNPPPKRRRVSPERTDLFRRSEVTNAGPRPRSIAPQRVCQAAVASTLEPRIVRRRKIWHNQYVRKHESGALIAWIGSYVCRTDFENAEAEIDCFGQLKLAHRAFPDQYETLVSATMREKVGCRWPVQFLEGQHIYFNSQKGSDICTADNPRSVDLVFSRWAGRASYNSREWEYETGSDPSIPTTSPAPATTDRIPTHMTQYEISRFSETPERFSTVLPVAPSPATRAVFHLDPFSPPQSVASCPCGREGPCCCFRMPCVCDNACRCDWKRIHVKFRRFAEMLVPVYSHCVPLGALAIRRNLSRVYISVDANGNAGVFANGAHPYDMDGALDPVAMESFTVSVPGDILCEYDGNPFIESPTNNAATNHQLYSHPGLGIIDGSPTTTLISYGPLINDRCEDNNAEISVVRVHHARVGALAAKVIGILPIVHNCEIGVPYGGEAWVGRERLVPQEVWQSIVRFYDIRADGTFANMTDSSSEWESTPSSSGSTTQQGNNRRTPSSSRALVVYDSESGRGSSSIPRPRADARATAVEAAANAVTVPADDSTTVCSEVARYIANSGQLLADWTSRNILLRYVGVLPAVQFDASLHSDAVVVQYQDDVVIAYGADAETTTPAPVVDEDYTDMPDLEYIGATQRRDYVSCGPVDLSCCKGGGKRRRSSIDNDDILSEALDSMVYPSDTTDRDVAFLHSPYTLPVGTEPSNGDCGPWMCLALMWALCWSFPEQFDEQSIPPSVASLRLLAVQVLIEAHETTLDPDTGTHIASDIYAANFFRDPEATDVSGAIPQRMLKRLRHETALQYRQRLAALYATCEADGTDAPVIWWGVDLAGAMLKVLITKCFVYRAGNHIEEWLADADPQFALISVGPLHIVCTDPTVAYHLTLTEESTQLHANCGVAYGVYTGGNHFQSRVNGDPYPFQGIVPADISDRAHTIGSCIITDERSQKDPVRRADEAAQIWSTQFPYSFGEMARDYMFIFDFPFWDKFCHGNSVSHTSVKTHGWAPVFAQSNCWVPEDFPILRSTVADLLADGRVFLIFCGLVEEDTDIFARALFSIVDATTDPRWDGRGGTVFTLAAQNHPVFPVEYTASAEDVVCYFPFEMLPPGMALNDFGTLYAPTDDVTEEVHSMIHPATRGMDAPAPAKVWALKTSSL